MDVRILGPLDVRDEGRIVPVGGPKQRALLALLALEAGKTLSSEWLLEALWHERRPGSGRKALQVCVSELRKALESDRPTGEPARVLVTMASGYRLELDPERVDAHRFERLVGEGRRALVEGEAERAATTLREALGLWRGPPLAGLSEPFAAIEAARLEEVRVAAIEDRVDADLSLGRHTELVGELEALVAHHPVRERLRGQLMLALYRSERQAEALEAFQRARDALVDELGIEPSRGLRELQAAILRQDPALDLLVPEAAPSPAPPEAARTPAAAPPPRPSERKLATLLFADLVASTRLGEQDPERTRVVLERFYDAMAEEVARTGGTVEKFIGDAVLAAFGVPAGQEDHAERALHAALAMRTRLDDLFERRLALRIGVNSGEVVVGGARAGSSFVTGDAVNVAKRLEEAAAPGEILGGARTAAAARGAFEFSDPRRAVGKGKRGGIGCRRLVRALALTRPRGVGVLGRSFVGRQSELELLRATYRRVVRQREAHLVTVVGDAGVGKTSLVRELWDWLASQSPEPLRRAGRCLPYGRGITYWPLGEVLKEHLGILESDPPDTVRARLGSREILGLTLGLESPGLHPLVAQERLHEGWTAFVDELVAERPLAVLVEDLNWAEEPLLDVLDRLRRDVRGPLLLVATARPELIERRSGWGAGGRNAAQLWLEPLTDEEAARMLDELLAAPLPPELRALLLGRAEGNPFFLEELVASLIDRGVLERVEGGWRAHELPSRFAVPDSVQSVLAARIDLLPAGEKAALQAAAVAGRVFWAGPVAELVAAQPDFRALEERDFVRRRRSSTMAGEIEFAFKHALTREVAYAGLPKARRAQLHAAFAGWLERVGAGRDEHAALLAHHYAEAVRPEDVDLAWPEREEELEALRAKARAWLRRAAALATGRYALDEQVQLFRRAIELEADAGARGALWHEVARANRLKFDQRGFREAMLEAIQIAAAPEAAAELYGELAFWDAFRWNHAEDRELIEGWIDRALELAPPASAARARALVARSYCRREEAEAAAREALDIVEGLPDVELRSYAVHAAADAALAGGRYDEARGWTERRLALLDVIDDPDHLADIYWNAIPGYLGEARFEEARRLADLHDEVTSGLSPHHRLHGVAFLLEVEELAGDWERIRELTPRAERAVEESTPCVHQPRSLTVCALAAACRGEEKEAARLEEAAEALGAEEYGRVVDARIRLALVRGDLKRVASLLDEAAAPQKTLIRSTKLAPLAARLDALAALRMRADVEAEAPPLLRPATYLEPFALRALGVVRADRSLLDSAAARFDAMGLVWHADRTRALSV
jgi:DNA-binding SARP family transcriptional activator